MCMSIQSLFCTVSIAICQQQVVVQCSALSRLVLVLQALRYVQQLVRETKVTFCNSLLVGCIVPLC